MLKHIYAGDLLCVPPIGDKAELAILAPLPWQSALWNKLLSIYRQGRLPHANLLSGQLGLGGDWFIYIWAAWLLCEQNNRFEYACGHCMYCRQFLHASHPDVYYLTPDPHEIKIDAVRALSTWLQRARYYSTPRIVLIPGAQLMNLSAGNALLKSLEEPPAHTYFLMTSTHIKSLLPTLRSRVQHYHLSKAKRTVAFDWLNTKIDNNSENIYSALRHAKGLPIDALKNLIAGSEDKGMELTKQLCQLLNNPHYPHHIIPSWSAASFDQLYLAEVWLELIYGMLQQQLCQAKHANIALPGKQLHLCNLWKFYEQLLEWIRALRTGRNFNVRLNLESLMYHWRSCAK